MATPMQALPKRLGGGLAVLLSVVLVLAQALGWMHRVWQDHGEPSQLEASIVSDAKAPDRSSWVAALFDHDAGSADCRLYDAAGQPGCPAAVHLAAAAPAPESPPAQDLRGFVARRVAPFHARGPPDSAE